MFGYITANLEPLPKDRQNRFRALYCGLCKSLRQRYGLPGSATLSYDMTFLAMLLNALYEPGETDGRERCPTHPVKRHAYVQSEALNYAADMNVALAYFKCLDDWKDDRNVTARAEAGLLKRSYRVIREKHPGQCEAIESWLEVVKRAEEAGKRSGIDAPLNATGRMLGELFDWKVGDLWSGDLRQLGDGLGRFIYFMDAYEDLPADIRKNRFNPLKPLRERADFEEFCRLSMMMMMADATDAYERLPIVRDADLLGNVLYSGVWTRYGMLQKRKQRAEHKGDS